MDTPAAGVVGARPAGAGDLRVEGPLRPDVDPATDVTAAPSADPATDPATDPAAVPVVVPALSVPTPAPHPTAGQRGQRDAVPWRTILATIGLTLATVAAVLLVREIHRVLTWIVVAAFFAIALNPVVDAVQARMPRASRALATLLVFVVVLLALGGLVAAFAVPLAREGTDFAGKLPDIIDDARAGRGPIGHLLDRTNALEYVQTHQERIRAFATGLTTPATGVLRGVATGVAGAVTVFVLAYLMVLESPKIIASTMALLPDTSQERVRRISSDCARSITGYISGNLLISVICGVLTYITLKIVGVPFAGLISLFVAVADLIPLVGATLGAVIAILAASVHSVTAALIVLGFFVIYQQLENHLLQPLIFSRTVKLNPLTVLVAILVAVELAGILGALLAIPVAGIIQVIVRDVWDHRRGRPKPEPTVGEERVPIS